MGRLLTKFLKGERVYCCAGCGTHFATGEDIVSKAFHGRTGPAILFHKAENYSQGPSENRSLTTGLHRVADIYCIACDTYMGWIYEEAFEESQKYKIGKCVLEKARLSKLSGPQ